MTAASISYWGLTSVSWLLVNEYLTPKRQILATHFFFQMENWYSITLSIFPTRDIDRGIGIQVTVTQKPGLLRMSPYGMSLSKSSKEDISLFLTWTVLRNYSQYSILVGCAFVNLANHGTKIFRKKNYREFRKAKLEPFAESKQMKSICKYRLYANTVTLYIRDSCVHGF